MNEYEMNSNYEARNYSSAFMSIHLLTLPHKWTIPGSFEKHLQNLLCAVVR
jgi:hypothetical protein